MPPDEREIERTIRYGLVAVFVLGLRRRDPGTVVNAAVGVIGTYLTEFVERTCGVKLQPWHHLYVDTAMITHAVGMLGPYDDIQWWDHVTHIHSATILGGAVFAICRRTGRDPGPRVVAAVACGGLLWELVEYAIHVGADQIGVEPVLVNYGKRDTLLDLLFDLVGAVLVLALGDRVLGDLATADT
ncbi:hypothetical protein [Halomicrobium mukohataei]|uniref:DUF2238 domain-containing protein n=2 Tax=Halomicrobium mukohataei TaxID=57705 RepID=C7P4R9_HALMD|nr:hypothetical protein [Halomicrobium mukohataei]ACV49490.1 conserved hypothetical protein [Halomicrobium mukohataei DSM 12286]QCD67153.1 hypothetical protein E5139_15940 [Halomicrobium mukohataei]